MVLRAKGVVRGLECGVARAPHRRVGATGRPRVLAARAQADRVRGSTATTAAVGVSDDGAVASRGRAAVRRAGVDQVESSSSSRVYKLQPTSRPSNSRLSKEKRKNRKDPKLRKQEKEREARTYRFLAISSSLLMFGLASGATLVRFFFTDMGEDGISLVDFYGTLSCTVGACVGMEFYARYAHKYVWHDWQPGWSLHESHHLPRTGPFEANDIYAVANAVPALSLCIYGFLNPGLVPAMCWGTGLGITLFGWMYMFIHDGLVHKRFPVGPLGELPSLKRIAVAHTIHHSEKFGGVPYGLFLAENELEKCEGGVEELDMLMERAMAKEKAELEEAEAARM
ncbi:beta-carotene hydroxylase [Chloropicon primus]|nr:beta-carotene hydroxylase [Chloropicon primus]